MKKTNNSTKMRKRAISILITLVMVMMLVPLSGLTALAASYTLTVAPNDSSMGTVSPSSISSVVGGTTVNLKATEKAGFEFVSWYAIPSTYDGDFGDNSARNTTFDMPDDNVSIIAVFARDETHRYSITTVNSGNGSTKASISGTTVTKAAAGETVKLEATPSAGSAFIRWEVLSGSGVSFASASSATTTFIMPYDDVRISALFYYVSSYPDFPGYPYYGYGYGPGSGNGYWMSSGLWYDYTIGLYYNPSGGYWQDGRGNFQYYDSYYGYYDGYYNGYYYGYPYYDGYYGYYGNGYWGSNGYFYDGNGNYYVPSSGNWYDSSGRFLYNDPYFDYYGYGYGYGYNGYYGYGNRYGVSTSVNNTAWGRATVSNNGAAYNSTVTITATPNAGYSFVNWEVLAGGVTLTNANSATTTFVMPYTAVSVRAVFEKTVTRYAAAASVNNSAWGIASVSSANEPQGAVILLTASANPGYEFSHWEVTSGVFVVANPVSPFTSFTMPASNATVNAVFKEIAASPVTPPPSPPPSGSGAASSWAAAGVTRAIALDIVPVQLQSNYTQFITRAEFCALAVAVYEKAMDREITGRVKFADTDDVNVEKAAAVGIVTGVGGDMFDPYATLTREQAAVILVSLATAIDKPLSMYSAAPPSDFSSVSSWAVDAVSQVMGAGIMIGVGANNFAPGGTCTREQSIIIMMRLFEMG